MEIFFLQWGNGKSSTEKGQFNFPFSIYLYNLEEIFYIGDVCSVQLFTKNNECIQRLGDVVYGTTMKQFYYVYSICVLDDRLYVCDYLTRQIKAFKRKD